MFDLITRPTLELTDRERNKVKSISRTLLTRLQDRLVLDWRNRQQSRAAVRLTVYETLGELPERYTQEIYDQTCEAVYQHIYDCYYGAGNSIYEAA